jgi:hypothetical protein
MEDVYQTADWKNKVLPGWIVGTAGAVRYRIPSEAGPAQKAQTDVYGYMIGTVSPDGSVSFEFQNSASKISSPPITRRSPSLSFAGATQITSSSLSLTWFRTTQ